MGDRLQRCIDSIAAQSYAAIEHIVIDGGSQDGTVEILQASPDVRWLSEQDRGQSDAINKGLRMATGDVLGWLNADDELAPGAVKRIVDAVQQTGVGLVYGDIELVEAGRSRRVRPSPTFGPEVLWKGNRISQPGTFWTRAAQDQVGLLDEDYHLTMDFELWLRFARAGVGARYIPEVLARFEVHDGSKTGSAGGLAFAEEEARALRKHGEVHGAAMAIDRWYWDHVLEEVGASLSEHDRQAAASLARRSLRRMRPVRDRVRLFLWVLRTWPWLGEVLYRRWRSDLS